MPSVDIEKLIRPHLVNIQSFSPVDPPEILAQRAGIALDKVVKLNGNENPYGGSPKAAEAMARAPLHIYPDPLLRKVRKALGEYTGMDPDYIIAGAGSDELIDLLFRLFISPGDQILDCDPTFAMYAFLARVADSEIVMVPRDELFNVDVDAVKRAIDSKTKIIFITSPNNPTGNLASESQIRDLLETGLIVAVDEAYYEFCGQTAADLVPDHENLVVLRTLSKWAGLAGLRIGYGIMSPRLVKHMIDIKQPYNVSVAAEAALLASIEDAPALLANVQRLVAERQRMFSLLESIPGVTPWPSDGNYILCRFAPGRALEIYEDLASRGIFVRNFGSERLRDFFRISVGMPHETDAVIEAMRELV